MGIHRPNWLTWVPADIPVFISHRVLAGMVRLPKRNRFYALDSGAFTELNLFGKFATSPHEYVQAVARYDTEIGRMDWAAPQDWMCEPFMLAKTGLTVEDHQHRTIENFIELTELWPEFSDDPECPIMPSVQGGKIDEYLRCIEMYEAAGVCLSDFPVVGVGSVCRRSRTDEIAEIFGALGELGLPLHGFGVKTSGLAKYGRWLETADSMAWSYAARWEPPAPQCEGIRKSCANCLHAALEWRERVLAVIAKRVKDVPARPQRSKFTSRGFPA